MSLTADDLQAIRTLIREEVRHTFQNDGRKIVREEIGIQLMPVEGRLTAIENDLKEIYDLFVYNGLKVIID